MPRFRLIWIFVLLFAVVGLFPATAQGNLLQNPGFDNSGSYRASGGTENFNFAPGWNGWWTNSPSTTEWMNIKPDGYPQTNIKRGGDAAQEIGRGGGTFTAAAYQVVNGIQEGTALTATAWIYLDNGPGTDARARVGIGSNTGGNPLGDIKWSSWLRSVNGWHRVSVDRVVPAGSVTIFIYTTQSFPNGPRGTNKIYIDDASLTVTGSGEPEAGNNTGDPANPSAPTTTPAPTATPAPVFAPFVQPQNNVEDGRIVHTVQSGDTLAAISVAYGVPINEIRERNNLSSSMLMIGQQLIISEASPTPEPVDDVQQPTTTPISSGDPAADSVNATPTDDATAGETTGDGPLNPLLDLFQPTGGDDATDAPAAEPTDIQPSPEPTEQTVAQATEPVEPTNVEPTNTQEPQVTPTPTDVPATPTDAPPAPVVTGSEPDPLSTEAEVCVMMFEDTDQNRIRGPQEGLLANGVISLTDGEGNDRGSYQTNGTDEPFCFEGLEPGSYRAIGTPPQGFGLTTPGTLFVSVQAGTSFQISFGAAQGVEVAAVPTADNIVDDDPAETISEEPESGPLNLGSIAGWLVLGLAGVVLVGGVVISLIARRL